MALIMCKFGHPICSKVHENYERHRWMWVWCVWIQISRISLSMHKLFSILLDWFRSWNHDIWAVGVVLAVGDVNTHRQIATFSVQFGAHYLVFRLFETLFHSLLLLFWLFHGTFLVCFDCFDLTMMEFSGRQWQCLWPWQWYFICWIPRWIWARSIPCQWS